MFRRSSKFKAVPRKKTGWPKLKIIGFFLLLVILMGGIWWGFKSAKTTYAIKLDETPCTDESRVKELLTKERIKFYWLQSQEIEKKLKQQFSCINEARVERQFPTSVAVTLTGRKPVAVFRVIQKTIPSPLPIEVLEATPSTQEAKVLPSPSPQVMVSYGEIYLVDQKGVAFSKASRDGLPFINLATNTFDIGATIGADNISHLLQVWSFFQNQGQQISYAELQDDKLTVKVPEEIVFSLSEDMERQTASLQLIWKQAKMNSKSVVKIDLRFGKPVVVYAPDKK